MLRDRPINTVADTLKVFDDLKNRNDFPDNVCAKLTSFRMITAEQFFVSCFLHFSKFDRIGFMFL